jgi:hypothetical protein
MTFGPHDFQRTDRGITWGIKVTAMDSSFVMVFLQDADGVWRPDTSTMAAQLDPVFENAMRGRPPVLEWFRDTLIPNLNRWLAEKFPPLALPPAPTTVAEQADALIQGLRITVHPDGTLTAAAS